jgi:hypothetical protein
MSHGGQNRDYEASRMRFDDWRAEKLRELGTGQWITAYESLASELETFRFYCGLAPLSSLEKVMSGAAWDIMIGGGRPGCVQFWDHGKSTIRYFRLGGDRRVEPLLWVRSFHGAAPDYVEVSEEFRLFHNLCWDGKRNVYVAFDESGDPNDVVIIKEHDIRIRSKHIKQYLAIREMALLLYFDLQRKSVFSTSELALNEDFRIVEPELGYRLYSGPFDLHPLRSFTCLFGKKVIQGFPKEKCGIWPFMAPEEYADFLIQRESGGEPILWRSNPHELANDFGANTEAPHYLTPVFFRREVLNKYYANPERYSVEDGYLRASGQWGLRMDNNHKDFVVVFLGDLGTDLHYKEQLYWKSFNVEPAEAISDVTFRRNFLGQFTNPSKIDLLFKQELENFNKDWSEAFGWQLFKPLSDADSHALVALHIPLSETQSEFDGQVLSISKLMIDSLNEAELAKAIPKQESMPKGIGKLALFFTERGVADSEKQIQFLRNLWGLRIGVGHRKGDAYEAASRHFDLDAQGYIRTFEEVLRRALDLLRFLRSAFLPPKSDENNGASS